ncbi:MAG: 37S ribosomal protein S16, mitochondrial [Tremellales sp. Tagirdzhanova-0007]|nr:MAG: 37S ribosomal protein S16, mitochondrial [Tremellales sp. Tagirdzhanova-0007]
MPLRIRLARHGYRNHPYYHLVVIDASKARNAMPLEKLGEYDPIPRVPSISALPSQARVFGKEHWTPKKEKKVEWNVERIRHWLGVGAQPTTTVVKLLERNVQQGQVLYKGLG